ncbi:MAG: LTA synthase family protein [Oligoflexia bacterium]|nr:LTA synthase family protein [Oligoflexia bacterium]
MTKSNTFLFFVRLIVLLLIILLLNRIVFAIYFSTNAHNFTISDLCRAFYLGFKFDLRLILFSLSPLLPLTALANLIFRPLPPSHWFWKILVRIYLNILIMVFFVFYAFDYGHYAYLQSKLSSTILQMLQNAAISFQMMRESYPMILPLLAFILILFTFDFIVRRKILPSTLPATGLVPNKPKLIKIILFWFVIILLWAAAIYGKISFYPLRWGEAYFVPNKFISAVALNPILNFYDTWNYREREYDAELTKKYFPSIKKFLKLPDNATPLNFTRALTPVIPHPLLIRPLTTTTTGTPPNVVVIIVESLVAYKTGTFKSPLNPTPYIDKLIKKSVFFDHFYVPSQATARSVFAFVTGIPDVTAQKDTSTRNPLIVDQHTLINEFKEHQKYYFLGGDANWGSIRGLLTNNINGIKIYEEKDYSYPRNDVWGISDYHLFLEANKVFKNENKPFFAIVQTSGFHRPMTIPKDRGSFEFQNLNQEEKVLLKEYGFESEEELHSLRFQDYSIGNFLQIAQKEKYFENTIFVIFGDHGLPVNDAKNVSFGEKIHDLENFHVPLIFHAPKFFKTQTIKKMVSEIDVLPILSSLFAIPCNYQTLGRDIFNNKYDDQNMLFVYYWYMRPSRYAVVSDTDFAPADTEGKKELFFYRTEQAGIDYAVEAQHSEKARELNDLANGIYNASKYLMHFNGKNEKNEKNEKNK